MTVHQFSLKTLMELDGGRVVEAWDQAVKRCVADCEDRPAVKKPRKVILELLLEPLCEQGSLDSVDGAFKVTDSAPKRETKTYNFGVRRGQLLVFNDLSDDDIHQKTIE
jgi:hypothetical protein